MRCETGHEYWRLDGIWRMLAPERAARFAQFMRDYESVRVREQRGSNDAAYYRALPYAVTGRWSADWAIRAQSYEALIHHVLEPVEAETHGANTILDLGAGNGWLSNRLVQRPGRHFVAAVDLQTNALDGLGAHLHYDTDFVPVQAEFEHLPFADGQFDLVIFNASLHYSEDYESTLREALRVVKQGGAVVILDTPVYRSAASGQRMMAERQQQFEQTYGFRSDALRTEGYLTHDRLAALGESLGVRWRLIRPRYGLRWMLRRVIGRIRTRREPAEFRLIVGTRSITG
jgi:SAM-dependent methyltransferase